MTRHRQALRRLCLAALLLAAIAGPAGAGDEAVLDGAVTRPLALSTSLLDGFPESGIDISFATSKGVEGGRYRGVLLWALVEQAGLAPLPGKNGAIRRTVLVTGRDGYQAALALAEIDPHYEGKAVLLAREADGLRLLVPGDRHGGRNVRDVVRIEVR